MKKILLVVVIIIFITLLLPLAIVWLIGGSGEGQSPIESGTVSVYVSEEDCVNAWWRRKCLPILRKRH